MSTFFLAEARASGTDLFFQHSIDTVGVVDVESISLTFDPSDVRAAFAVAQHFNGTKLRTQCQHLCVGEFDCSAKCAS